MTTTAVTFAPLGPAEDPELGLFFIESEEAVTNEWRANLTPSREDPRAAGMAFLVHSSGLLATASHVPLRCNAVPGQRLPVFGASGEVPIELQAEVLEAGWLGPVERTLPMSAVWPSIVDERPDVFRQDVCLMRLLPETARPHRRQPRSRPMDDARAELLTRARVLPLGIPTRHSRGASVKCWVVAWEQRAPACHAANAEIEGVEPGLHDAVRMRGGAIGHGFSGSPVWDVRRRLVVGVHRRGVATLPDIRLATDPRALVGASGVLSLAGDCDLQGLLDLPRRESAIGDSRYSEFLGWDASAVMVEQQVSMIGVDSGFASNGPALDAAGFMLDALRSEAPVGILLQGAAGTGKSTLLRATASALSMLPVPGRAFLSVPALVTARELVQAGFELRVVLDSQLARAGATAAGTRDTFNVLEENGARLVLFVDGLDEVPAAAARRILALFGPGARGSAAGRAATALLHHCVFASRPTDDLRAPFAQSAGRDALRVRLHELPPADASRLADKLLPEMDGAGRAQFHNSMADLRLTAAGATPLQVWMAAVIFKAEGRLPKRPLDLVHEFVRVLAQQGILGLMRQRGARLSDHVANTYLAHVQEILSFVAHAFRQYENTGIGEDLLRRHLESDASEAPRPTWMHDTGGLVDFIFGMLPQAAGVIHVKDGPAGPEIGWLHASILDYFAARHVLARSAPLPSARSELVIGSLTARDQWFALTLLSEMERSAEVDAVQRTLGDCLAKSASVIRPRLFALRALAIGIDAQGRYRAQQVRALVSQLVSGYHERMACEAVFHLEGLPEPMEILARPELRDDVRDALMERFRVRLRARAGKPLRPLATEQKVIDAASLSCEMEVLGVERLLPDSDGRIAEPGPLSKRPAPRALGTAAVPASGDTEVVVRGSAGQLVHLWLPSARFAEYLAQTARRYPNADAGALVALIAQWVIEQDPAHPAER